MRHRVKTESLSRFSSYRKATIRSIAKSVLLNEKIITTKAKAKAARCTIDKIISLGKDNSLASRRRAFSLLCDHKMVKMLFDQIAPKFAKRIGGYTRIIPYRHRRGDNAKLVILQLTETYKAEKVKKEIKQEKEAKPKKELFKKRTSVVTEKEKKKEAVLPTQEELIKELEKEKEYKPKEQKKQKAPVEEKETPEQKKVAESKVQTKKTPEKEEAEKSKEKKPKKFFSGLKSFFRKNKDLK